MKKLICFCALFIFVCYNIGKNVQGSGTYTPSISIKGITPPQDTESILKNMSYWFDGSFEEISTIPGIKKAWRHRKYSDIILNIVEIEKDRPIGMKEFDPKLYVKALGETREIIHLLAGIKDWKLLKADVNKRALPKVGKLQLQGKYKSAQDIEFFFYETQIFKGRKYLQFQLSMPYKTKEIVNEKIVKSMFKHLEKNL